MDKEMKAFAKVRRVLFKFILSYESINHHTLP